ncbi:MAG: hypothetical protein AAF378_16790 [Cyanobacteria bacterium P01_A01_bin.84]
MSKEGLTPQKIASEFGFINLAQIHAALAYYYANQEEIEGYLAQEEAEYKRLETE